MNRLPILLSVILLLCGMEFPVRGAEHVGIRFLDSAAVNDTVILLRDIAVIDGESALVEKIGAAKVGESAPAGYYRWVDGKDAVHFYLLSRFRQVDFNVTHQARVKVYTRFGQHSVSRFEKQILAYLQEGLKWRPDEWTCEIREKTFKTLDRPFVVEVEGLKDSFARGSIPLKLRLLYDGQADEIDFTCRINVKASVIVAAGAIQRNKLIEASDLTIQRVDITGNRYEPYRDKSSLIGMRCARAVRKGSVLTPLMITEDPAVKRGDQVYINLNMGAIKISVPARAREAGRKGENIWVENLQTNKLIRVEVAGEGLVTMTMKGTL